MGCGCSSAAVEKLEKNPDGTMKTAQTFMQQRYDGAEMRVFCKTVSPTTAKLEAILRRMPKWQVNAREHNPASPHIGRALAAHGENALHTAVQAGWYDGVRMLLVYGADPMVPNPQGNTAIHLAAAKGYVEIMRALLKHPKIDLMKKNADQQNPMHLAAMAGNWAMVQLLCTVAKKPNFDQHDVFGNTPGMYAVQNGHYSFIKAMKNASVPIDADKKNDDGFSLLAMALAKPIVSFTPTAPIPSLPTPEDGSEFPSAGAALIKAGGNEPEAAPAPAAPKAAKAPKDESATVIVEKAGGAEAVAAATLVVGGAAAVAGGAVAVAAGAAMVDEVPPADAEELKEKVEEAQEMMEAAQEEPEAPAADAELEVDAEPEVAGGDVPAAEEEPEVAVDEGITLEDVVDAAEEAIDVDEAQELAEGAVEAAMEDAEAALADDAEEPAEEPAEDDGEPVGENTERAGTDPASLTMGAETLKQHMAKYTDESPKPEAPPAYTTHAEFVSDVLSGARQLKDIGPEGQSAVEMACGLGDKDIIQEMLAHVEKLKMPKLVTAKNNKTGNTPFMRACFRAPLEIIEIFLTQHGVQVDGKDATNKNGDTPLHFAAAGGNKDVVQKLLDSGCSPEAANKDKLMPVHYALAGPPNNNYIPHKSEDLAQLKEWDAMRTEAARILLSKASDTVKKEKVGESEENLLHMACKTHSPKLVQECLNIADLNVNSINAFGDTALILTAMSATEKTAAQDAAVLHLLLKAGADPAKGNADGNTVVYYMFGPEGKAPSFAKLSSFLIKISKPKMDWNMPVAHDGDTPLMLAALGDDTIAINFLLGKCGANINTVNKKNGKTALFRGVEGGAVSAVALLLVKGASWQLRDKQKHTCLHAALEQDGETSLTMASLLIKSGMPPANLTDESGHGFLHRAVFYGDYNFIKTWARFGGDLDYLACHPDCERIKKSALIAKADKPMPTVSPAAEKAKHAETLRDQLGLADKPLSADEEKAAEEADKEEEGENEEEDEDKEEEEEPEDDGDDGEALGEAIELAEDRQQKWKDPMDPFFEARHVGIFGNMPGQAAKRAAKIASAPKAPTYLDLDPKVDPALAKKWEHMWDDIMKQWHDESDDHKDFMYEADVARRNMESWKLSALPEELKQFAKLKGFKPDIKRKKPRFFKVDLDKQRRIQYNTTKRTINRTQKKFRKTKKDRRRGKKKAGDDPNASTRKKSTAGDELPSPEEIEAQAEEAEAGQAEPAPADGEPAPEKEGEEVDEEDDDEEEEECEDHGNAVTGVISEIETIKLHNTSAISYAIRLGRIQCLEAILEASTASVNMPDGWGVRPMGYASLAKLRGVAEISDEMWDKFTIAQGLLLEHDRKPDVYKGKTLGNPIVCALLSRDDMAVHMMVKRGSGNPNTGNFGLTPEVFHYLQLPGKQKKTLSKGNYKLSVRYKNLFLKAFEFLMGLKKKADAAFKKDMGGDEKAVEKDPPKTFDKEIVHKDIGEYPLSLLCMSIVVDSINSTRNLLAAHANPDVRLPFTHMVPVQGKKCIKIPDVNCPLGVAASVGRYKHVALLLKAGADPNGAKGMIRSPIRLAVDWAQSAVRYRIADKSTLLDAWDVKAPPMNNAVKQEAAKAMMKSMMKAMDPVQAAKMAAMKIGITLVKMWLMGMKLPPHPEDPALYAMHLLLQNRAIIPWGDAPVSSLLTAMLPSMGDYVWWYAPKADGYVGADELSKTIMDGKSKGEFFPFKEEWTKLAKNDVNAVMKEWYEKAADEKTCKTSKVYNKLNGKYKIKVNKAFLKHCVPAFKAAYKVTLEKAKPGNEKQQAEAKQKRSEGATKKAQADVNATMQSAKKTEASRQKTISASLMKLASNPQEALAGVMADAQASVVAKANRSAAAGTGTASTFGTATGSLTKSLGASLGGGGDAPDSEAMLASFTEAAGADAAAFAESGLNDMMDAKVEQVAESSPLAKKLLQSSAGKRAQGEAKKATKAMKGKIMAALGKPPDAEEMEGKLDELMEGEFEMPELEMPDLGEIELKMPEMPEMPNLDDFEMPEDLGDIADLAGVEIPEGLDGIADMELPDLGELLELDLDGLMETFEMICDFLDFLSELA